ncbi:unnamed protein product [Sphagnum jensenii]
MEATNEELCSVHTQNDVERMKAVSSKSYGKHQRKALASPYDSILFNNGSSKSALLAAGSVIEVADQVAQGKLKAGAAIKTTPNVVVRPPGHHAKADAAMGFCLFSNVAACTLRIIWAVFAHSVSTNMDFVPAEFSLLFENCIIEPFIISVFKPIFSTLMKSRSFSMVFVLKFSANCDLKKGIFWSGKRYFESVLLNVYSSLLNVVRL